MKTTDVCYGIMYSGVGCTANLLTGLGSLACLFGGIGYMASFSLNEQITANYYGELGGKGIVDANVSLTQLNQHQSIHVPLDESKQYLGDDEVNLKHFLKKEELQIISAIFFGAGTLLKILGRILSLWLQGKEERRYFYQLDEIHISSASWLEYALVTAAAFFQSISLAAYGVGLVGTVVNAFKLPGSSQQLTYPFKNEYERANCSYPGPLASKNFSFRQHASIKTSINLPELSQPLKMKIDFSVNLHAALVYGAGLFLHSEQNKSKAWPAVIAAGAVSDMAACFFSRKQREKRDKRLHDAEQETYNPTADEIELLVPLANQTR